MQFKFLNFHKMLANFSVNIIGVFIPLILYTYTQNILISLLYLVFQNIGRIAFVTVFRKHIEKRPQLFLLIRVVPMLLYASSVLLLDVNIWLGVASIMFFSALSEGLSAFSNEVILNYSSLNRGGKSFGLTRFFEQLGIIISVLAGGLFLDYLNKNIVIILSITIYLISVIPLTYYYIKFRKEPNFNQEAISNAFLTYNQKQENNQKIKKVTGKILTYYFVLYFVMCFLDSLVNMFNLYYFTKTGTYTYASLISASFNGAFGIGSYIVGKLNEKFDTTLMITIGGIIISVLIAILPFVVNEVLIIVIFSVIGGLYPLASITLIERMLIKTRILGCSNRALFNRERGALLGKVSGYALAFPSFLVCFMGIAVALVVFAVLFPKYEEKTRKILVSFLEGSY